MELRRWAVAATLVLAACGGQGSQAGGSTLVASGPCPNPAAASLGHSAPSKGIAFAGVNGKLTHIYAVNADGTGLRQLTNDEFNDTVPQWSPDATRITFLREEPNTKGLMQIFVMNSDGTGASRLTCAGSGDSRPAWSPDGSLIAFGRYEATGGDSIYVMKPDGTGLRRVFQSSTGQPKTIDKVAWSPDGKRFAFGDETGIAIVNVDGTGFKQLTTYASDIPDSEPAWSPDGRSIAFSRSVLISTQQGADMQVWIMSAVGLNAHVFIARPGCDVTGPTWSAHGTQMAYAFGCGQKGQFSIDVVNSTGAGAHALFGPVTTYVDSPNWSSAG